MPVNSTHPCYDKALCKWQLTRAIIDNDAKRWIREIDVNDPGRSKQYRDDAILTNFTRLTKIGLTGLVFRKPAKIELPEGIQYLLADATGYGFTIEQLAQQIVGETLTTGRYGLLVDCPLDGDNTAKIKPYTAESIINWKYTNYGSAYYLSLVVLHECIDGLGDDGFEWVKRDQYRVLLLDNDGYYRQALYNHEYELVTVVTPLDYKGDPLTYIPFSFIGSENNDAAVDSIPLYDLAVVNLGHYRNSADVEETSFISGQAVPVIQLGDTNEAEFKQANPGGIKIGSRAGIILGNGGSFTFAQVQANLLPRELMKDKESQATAIGARLIAPPGGRETAEAARIRFGSQNSALYTLTKNVSLAFSQCINWVMVFMLEVPKEIKFELNDQFYDESADPNMIAQEIMLLDRGAISINEIRENMRLTGVQLDRDFTPEINPLQEPGY